MVMALTETVSVPTKHIFLKMHSPIIYITFYRTIYIVIDMPYLMLSFIAFHLYYLNDFKTVLFSCDQF